MQKITFDTGIKTYQINDSGVLRFNPSDPNLYKRCKDLRVEIERIQKDITNVQNPRRPERMPLTCWRSMMPA